MIGLVVTSTFLISEDVEERRGEDTPMRHGIDNDYTSDWGMRPRKTTSGMSSYVLDRDYIRVST